MEDMIAKFNLLFSSNDNIELELSYTVAKSQSMYDRLYDAFSGMSTCIELVQHVDVYYIDNTRRIIIFKKGVNQKCDTIMKKRLLAKPIWIDTIKMKLCSEDPVLSSNSQIKLIRIKQRVRFIMDDKFDIEMDLIRNIDPQNATTLKAIKDSLFGSVGVDVDQFDELKIETEFKQGDINLLNVQRSIDMIKTTIG